MSDVLKFKVKHCGAGFYISVSNPHDYLLSDGRLVSGNKWDHTYNDFAYWENKDEAEEFITTWKEKHLLDGTPLEHPKYSYVRIAKAELHSRGWYIAIGNAGAFEAHYLYIDGVIRACANAGSENKVGSFWESEAEAKSFFEEWKNNHKKRIPQSYLEQMLRDMKSNTNAHGVIMAAFAYPSSNRKFKKVPTNFFARCSYALDIIGRRAQYDDKEQRREIAQYMWDNYKPTYEFNRIATTQAQAEGRIHRQGQTVKIETLVIDDEIPPHPGEHIGIVYSDNRPLYCEVRHTGSYRVINGGWSMNPKNPPNQMKDFRIVLRNMKSMHYNKACELIEQAAKGESPMDPIDDIFLTVTNDGRAYQGIIQTFERYRDGERSLGDLHQSFMTGCRRAGVEERDWRKYEQAINHALFAHYSEEIYGERCEHPSSPEKSPSVLQQEIVGHMETALTHFKKVNNSLAPKEEYSMIKIEKLTLVNDVDVADMSDDEIFTIIAKAEGEITKLKEIKVESKKVKAKIDEKQKGIDDLVAILDAR